MRSVRCDTAASVVHASNTCVGSRRGTVSTWSYTQRWSYPSDSALRATALLVSHASAAFIPESSSFQPCGTNAPNFAVMARDYGDLDVRIFESAAELGAAAATDAATAIRDAVNRRGVAHVMFASNNSQFAFLAALTTSGDVA